MNILDQLDSIGNNIDPVSRQKAQGLVEETLNLTKSDPKFIEALTLFSATMYDMISISNKLGRRPKNIGELAAAAKEFSEHRESVEEIAPALVCSMYTMLKNLEEEGFIKIIPPTDRKALKVWADLKKTKLAK